MWFDKISGEWNDLSYRQMRNSGEIYLHTKISINKSMVGNLMEFKVKDDAFRVY